MKISISVMSVATKLISISVFTAFLLCLAIHNDKYRA